MHVDRERQTQKQTLVLHLCWIIGELLSPAMCGADSKADIAGFFEALEMLAYEAISDRAEDADKKRRTLGRIDTGKNSPSDLDSAANAPASFSQDDF